MSDSISRQAAIDALCKRCDLVHDVPCTEECNDIKILRKLPSTDRKGQWILTHDGHFEFCTCSECGYDNGENWMIGSEIPFCWHCGADMRGE